MNLTMMTTLIFALLLSSPLTAPSLASPTDPADGKQPASSDRSMPLHDQTRPRLTFVPRTFDGIPTQDTRMVTAARAPVRGADLNPDLFVLLPSHVAVTTQSQPSLFYYLSKPTDRDVKITLNAPGSVVPVLSLTLNGSDMKGIQRLDLSRLSIELSPQTRYEWVVTVVLNPDSPAENIYAKSVLWRVPMPESLRERFMGQDRFQRAVIAADEGMWIDALANLCDLVDQHPNDLALRQDRADLLRQVDFNVTIKSLADGRFDESIQLTRRTSSIISP